MEGIHIGRILRLTAPLGLGFVHKTDMAITQGAGVATGITADTGRKICSKGFPAFCSIKRFPGGRDLLQIASGGFIHSSSHHNIRDHGVSMHTGGAIIPFDKISGDHFLKTGAADSDAVSCFKDLTDILSWQSGLNFTVFQHSQAGYPDHNDMIPGDLTFLDQAHDVTAHTPLGHDGHPVCSSYEQLGQIPGAEAGPAQLIDLFRSRGKKGSGTHGNGTLRIPKHTIHRALSQKLSGRFSDFLCSFLHQPAVLISLMSRVLGPNARTVSTT